LITYLGVDTSEDGLSFLLDAYRPEKGDTQQKGTHFSAGQVERFKEVFTPEQLQNYTQYFASYLVGMGYAK
jgi:hypothetical protein